MILIQNQVTVVLTVQQRLVGNVIYSLIVLNCVVIPGQINLNNAMMEMIKVETVVLNAKQSQGGNAFLILPCQTVLINCAEMVQLTLESNVMIRTQFQGTVVANVALTLVGNALLLIVLQSVLNSVVMESQKRKLARNVMTVIN